MAAVRVGPEQATFSKRVADFVKKVSYRRAETETDLDAIRHIRYTAYLKEGAISVSTDERLVDQFDEMGRVVNIGLYYDDTLISALRLHFLETAADLSPAMESFPDALKSRLGAGRRIVDPNRFVADFESARIFPELPYATLRLSMMASAYFNADFITATVRAEHHAFYKRTFFATPTCPPRKYPLLSKKIGLMLVDYANDRDRILDRNPFFAATEEECAALFGARNESASKRKKLQSAA